MSSLPSVYVQSRLYRWVCQCMNFKCFLFCDACPLVLETTEYTRRDLLVLRSRGGLVQGKTTAVLRRDRWDICSNRVVFSCKLCTFRCRYGSCFGSLCSPVSRTILFSSILLSHICNSLLWSCGDHQDLFGNWRHVGSVDRSASLSDSDSRQRRRIIAKRQTGSWKPETVHRLYRGVIVRLGVVAYLAHTLCPLLWHIWAKSSLPCGWICLDATVSS